MPFQAQNDMFAKAAKKEHKSIAPLKEHPKVREAYVDNIDEGTKKLIKQGDHLAEILRRVSLGMLAPQRMIDNAIDEWESIAVGFEKED